MLIPVISLVVAGFAIAFLLVLGWSLCVVAKTTDAQLEEEEKWIEDHPVEHTKMLADAQRRYEEQCRAEAEMDQIYGAREG